MATTKDVSRLDPEVVIPKIKNFKQKLGDYIAQKKRFVILLVIIGVILLFFGYRQVLKNSRSNSTAKTVTVQMDKSFTFAALNNQGKPTSAKIKLRIVDAQKTDQVLVKDQTYKATNNKLFLIFNLELKNDETTPQNIMPGDLVRLAVAGNEDTRFAPDLHNSLVGIAAISTKNDRVGFVIPQDANKFKLYIGELEGKKEEIKVDFPS
ncbi:hypothetical protein HY029_03370 [Candidatus Gottesmanbacteria bacterium]|nr:hypothetical protein [Candidatus Gottesmanbacteria bacterium]